MGRFSAKKHGKKGISLTKTVQCIVEVCFSIWYGI